MIRHVEETMIVAGAMAVAALLAGRLRGVGPASRHVFWLAVLIKLLTPPWIPAPWPTPASWLALDPPPRDDVAVAVAVGPAPTAVITPAARSAQFVDRSAGAVPHEVRRAHDLDASLSSNADLDPVPAASRPRVNRPEHDAPPRKTTSPPLDVWSRIPAFASLERVLLPTWLLATFALAAFQGRRILRFRGRLRGARPAPAVLVEAARAIAAQMRVRPPEMWVVTDLAVPSIWCLGRPRLLLPEAAVENLPLDAWHGVLAHELAHLKRGDHWVSRLELVAGLVWWWNPLFRLARRRIDAEAELACDAWVVSTLPDERLGYAAALLNICERLALAATPAPALGVTGSGRFMERRLNMILSERVPCRVSPVGFLAAGLMLIVALPSWSAAKWNGPAQAAAYIPAAAADPFATADDQDDKDAVKPKSKAKAKAAEAKDKAAAS
ncbi:MAG: M56 family metallopeptidase, partial [Planctomycetota bacterium]|nr:M56 family metallopeptidase [Planctomycetota bacterium]